MDEKKSKIALVTGANKGIGFETARQLARDHGFLVLIGARDSQRGEDAARQLISEGLHAQFVRLDATDAESIGNAARQIEREFGRLDVLVNNAGLLLNEDFVQPSHVTLDVLRRTYEVNVFGVAAITQAFWELLEKSEAARLVNVLSQLGSLTLNSDFDSPGGKFKALAYNSSKAALNMLTLHYAFEWRETPHRANSAHPGSVKTDLNTGGDLDVETGALTSVRLATLGADAPNGKFFHLEETLPW